MKPKTTYRTIWAMLMLVFLYRPAFALTDISGGYPSPDNVNVWAIIGVLLMGIVVIYAATFYLILADGPEQNTRINQRRQPFKRISRTIRKEMKTKFYIDNNDNTKTEAEELMEVDIGGES